MRHNFISESTAEDLNVSHLSNNISLSENPADEIESSTPPTVMLMTIILLIASLFLTSFMMLHYAKRHNRTLTDATLNSQQDTSGLHLLAASSFLKKLSPAEPKAATPSVATAIEPADKNNVIDQLFKSRGSNVKWPKLKLTGFGTASDGSDGFAIINNQQYHVGQFINGKARLLEVRKHDVLVELDGKTKTLSVNISN